MTEQLDFGKIQLNLPELLEEAFVSHPELFSGGDWVPLVTLLTHTLHKFDVHRIKLMFTDRDGKVDTTRMKGALIRALNDLGYVEIRGESVDKTEYRIKELPDTSPKTLKEAKRQLRTYREALRSWKDLGALIVDVHGVVGALRATTEHQERVNRRMAMLAMFYRDLLVEYQEAIKLNEDRLKKEGIYLPRLKNIDPSPAELGDMVMKPEKYIKVTRLVDQYNKISETDSDAK